MMGLWMVAAWASPMDDGTAAFERGDLDAAITAWSKPLEEGHTLSGVAEYNVATAHLRRGDWPRAIVHLRAAGRLRPRDGDVQHNLALARSEVGVVPPAVTLPTVWEVITPGELGLLGVLLAALGSAALVGWRFHYGPGWPAGGALLAAGLTLGGASTQGAMAVAAHPVAVVVDAPAVLRDAASVSAAERFRLPPGAEIRVERSYTGFLLVEDGRQRRGWVARGAVELSW